MSLDRTNEDSNDALLEFLKVISGRRIEDERRRRRLTQRQLSVRTGLSIRWLREIEGGNPIVKLDDHLRCAGALRLAPTYIFLPLLYRSYGRVCPIDVGITDLTDLEQRTLALATRHLGRQHLGR